MAYIVQIVPVQKKGPALQSMSLTSTLLIENPTDTSGLLPMTVNLVYDNIDDIYYFPVNAVFFAEDGYKFTMNLEFTLTDGTVCNRQYISYDEVLPLAAYTTGFSIGFLS